MKTLSYIAEDALHAPIRWFCADCKRVFRTQHTFKMTWGARFHNQKCGQPLRRVRMVAA